MKSYLRTVVATCAVGLAASVVPIGSTALKRNRGRHQRGEEMVTNRL